MIGDDPGVFISRDGGCVSVRSGILAGLGSIRQVHGPYDYRAPLSDFFLDRLYIPSGDRMRVEPIITIKNCLSIMDNYPRDQ